MNILTKLSNDIPELIRKHIDLFDSFKHVYLFGSSLDPNTTYNDIDILTIYTRYSSKIHNDLSIISNELEKASGVSIDLTALSIEEERETAFLERIKPHYLKLK